MYFEVNSAFFDNLLADLRRKTCSRADVSNQESIWKINHYESEQNHYENEQNHYENRDNHYGIFHNHYENNLNHYFLHFFVK